jgi:hypothetical protein
MVKFPPIQVRLHLHDHAVYYGILYQREVVIDSVKSGQIWVKSDPNLALDSFGIKHMWILDSSIVSMEILAPQRKSILGVYVCAKPALPRYIQNMPTSTFEKSSLDWNDPACW